MPVEEEIARVVPLIQRLAADGSTVSVDTWHAPVARAALGAGAAIVNDVSALSDLRGGRRVRRARRAPRDHPHEAAPKVKAFPRYDDVVADVIALLRERAPSPASAAWGRSG